MSTTPPVPEPVNPASTAPVTPPVAPSAPPVAPAVPPIVPPVRDATAPPVAEPPLSTTPTRSVPPMAPIGRTPASTLTPSPESAIVKAFLHTVFDNAKADISIHVSALAASIIAVASTDLTNLETWAVGVLPTLIAASINKVRVRVKTATK